jgi:hypothetical protein
VASTFCAFVRRDRLPTAAQVSRALSSRGDRVALRTESGLDQVGGTLAVEVNGAAVSVGFQVVPSASLVDGASGDLGPVLRNSDLRISVSGEGAEGERWAREVARGVAILGVGAFHNTQSGAVLFYGG